MKGARRLELLEAGCAAVGAAWVEHVERGLRFESRPVAGGWPGTLREAHARVCAYFTKDRFTADELHLAARTAYGCARHDWMARVGR